MKIDPPLKCYLSDGREGFIVEISNDDAPTREVILELSDGERVSLDPDIHVQLMQRSDGSLYVRDTRNVS